MKKECDLHESSVACSLEALLTQEKALAPQMKARGYKCFIPDWAIEL